jgi:L-iditol 2-dehydrogenase
MKALRKLQRGPGHVEIVHVEPPCPGPGEVLVQVRCAGVCGTDVHIYHDLFPKVRPPVTLGHEFCGVVSALGPGVGGWKKGARVTVESAAAFCGRCIHCLAGETQRCEERQALGYARDGGFAHLVAVRHGALHGLPDHVSFEEGALCEPLACATHAVMERSSLGPGQVALVTGPGPIGLLVSQVCRAAGARVVLVGAEHDGERLRLGEDLGVDAWAGAQGRVVEAALGALDRHKGADVLFECSGAPAAVAASLEWVRRGGEIVQVGLLGKGVELDLDRVAFKEIQVRGSFAHHHGSWEKAVALLNDGKVRLGPLVSGVFPLERWREAFSLFESRVGLKYLLCPQP